MMEPNIHLQKAFSSSPLKLVLKDVIDSSIFHSSIVAIVCPIVNKINHQVGSGVLISKDIVLTAAHNICSKDYTLNKKSCRVYFNSDGSDYCYVQDWWFSEKYIQMIQNKPKTNHEYDYALIKLKNPNLPIDKKYLKLAISCAQCLIQKNDSTKLNIFGFPLKQQNPPLYGNNFDQIGKNKIGLQQFGMKKQNSIQKIQKDIFIKHLISTQFGQSGSPIVVDEQIIAIHIGHNIQQQNNFGRLITQNLVANIQEQCQHLNGSKFIVNPRFYCLHIQNKLKQKIEKEIEKRKEEELQKQRKEIRQELEYKKAEELESTRTKYQGELRKEKNKTEELERTKTKIQQELKKEKSKNEELERTRTKIEGELSNEKNKRTQIIGELQTQMSNRINIQRRQLNTRNSLTNIQRELRYQISRRTKIERELQNEMSNRIYIQGLQLHARNSLSNNQRELRNQISRRTKIEEKLQEEKSKIRKSEYLLIALIVFFVFYLRMLQPNKPSKEMVGLCYQSASLIQETGIMHFNQHNYTQSLKYYAEALQTYGQAKDKGCIQSTKTLFRIGLISNNQPSQSIKYKRLALQILQKIKGIQNLEQPKILNKIKLVCQNQQNQAQISKACFQSIKIIIIIGKHQLKDKLKVLEYYHLALKIYKGEKKRYLVQPQSITIGLLYQTAPRLHQMGEAYLNQQNYSQALKYFALALQMYEQVKGKECFQSALTLHEIGFVYDNQLNYAKALEYYTLALQIKERVKGKGCFESAVTLHCIGSVYYNQQNYAKALEYYKQAQNIYENDKNRSIQVRGYAILLWNIGVNYYKLEDYEQAAQSFSSSLQIYELQNNKEWVKKSAVKLADCLRRLKREKESQQIEAKYGVDRQKSRGWFSS